MQCHSVRNLGACLAVFFSVESIMAQSGSVRCAVAPTQHRNRTSQSDSLHLAQRILSFVRSYSLVVRGDMERKNSAKVFSFVDRAPLLACKIGTWPPP